MFSIGKTKKRRQNDLTKFENSARTANPKLRRDKILGLFGKISSLDESIRALEEHEKNPTIESLKKVQKALEHIPENKRDKKYRDQIRELQYELAHEEIGLELRSKRLQDSKVKLLSPEEQNRVEKWIENVVKMINDEDFEAARSTLMEEGFELVSSQGAKVYKFRVVGDVVRESERNQYRPDINQIKFSEISNSALNTLDKPTKTLVLLRVLEEYMHYYQARSNKYLSPNTGLFKLSGIVPDDAEFPLRDDAEDYDEIDVYAKILDWGFNDMRDPYNVAYVGREKYKEWREQISGL